MIINSQCGTNNAISTASAIASKKSKASIIIRFNEAGEYIVIGFSLKLSSGSLTATYAKSLETQDVSTEKLDDGSYRIVAEADGMMKFGVQATAASGYTICYAIIGNWETAPTVT